MTAVALENMNEHDNLIYNKNLFFGAPWDIYSNYESDLNTSYYHLFNSNYFKINSSDTLFMDKYGKQISGNLLLKNTETEKKLL